MISIRRLMLASCLAAVAAPATASTNVLPAHWSVISVNGFFGTLRAGSPWGPGSTASNALSPINGTFEPASQQWNKGSFWWDQDPSVNASPVTWEVLLNQSFTFDRFVVQADDNDTYLVEYWDGAMYQSAFAVPFACCFGLQTRDSGTVSAISTNRFRLTATGGDNYYSLSEFQAFAIAVPEPSTWALMILGFGLVGGALRQRKTLALSYG